MIATFVCDIVKPFGIEGIYRFCGISAFGQTIVKPFGIEGIYRL